MAKNAFIIHGSYGKPQSNWFMWLTEELRKDGYVVFTPQFPTPKGQSLASWMAIFEPYEKDITSDTVLVGHSLGCAFILSILQKIPVKIKGTFLVAGFAALLANPLFDTVNKTFVTKTFDWEAIKSHGGTFQVYYSDNDPYVPAEKSIEIARHVGSTPILVKGAGHFNDASGYTHFEALKKDITLL